MNLGVAVTREAQRRPNALALFSLHFQCTYSELDTRTNQIARWFRTTHQLESGDRLAVLLPNRCEVVEHLTAAHKAALVYIGLNFRMDEGDFRTVFENAEPRLLVTCEEFRSTAESLLQSFGVPFVMIEDITKDIAGSPLATVMSSIMTNGTPKDCNNDSAVMRNSSQVTKSRGSAFSNTVRRSPSSIRKFRPI